MAEMTQPTAIAGQNPWKNSGTQPRWTKTLLGEVRKAHE
jgi:hypothetical protein